MLVKFVLKFQPKNKNKQYVTTNYNVIINYISK